MILSKENLSALPGLSTLKIPAPLLVELPEKVLQFGTGVLLRGLPDYFIDKANKQGVFNGRIVVVKSTSHGDTSAFDRQDNFFTQCIRGIEDGKRVDDTVINTAISRVLTATSDWAAILDCASQPDMQIIISNTTEVGIVLNDHEDVHAHPPLSFPGKLLAFLLARYTAFRGSAESGMVIIPTELLPGNGTRLKEIVLELARQNKLDQGFIDWLSNENDFCNSLVDRIVPGQLPGDDKAAMESKLGYKDDLMIMSEVYRLWAIETSSPRTKQLLSFSQADAGVVIAADIEKFRELKLRLLNGSHTFTCGLALLLGFSTVKQAMEDALFEQFITRLMQDEIVPAIIGEKISAADGNTFAAAVIDRYKNPFIEHQWLSISLQYSSKMKMRNVPVLQQYYARKGSVPQLMALGFAAYLLFMKSEPQPDGGYRGTVAGKSYAVNDDKAADLQQLWLSGNTDNFVGTVLAATSLWGANLDILPGFRQAIAANLSAIETQGIRNTLQETMAKQTA